MNQTVLIADDEPNIVVSLEYLLEHNGYQVKIARTGDEALTLAEQLKPDLILLDIMLPGKSGFDVCQKVRANAALNGTRIIMLTAKGREIEVSKGLALGADAYISKPFSTKDLIAEVRRQLGDT